MGRVRWRAATGVIPGKECHANGQRHGAGHIHESGDRPRHTLPITHARAGTHGEGVDFMRLSSVAALPCLVAFVCLPVAADDLETVVVTANRVPQSQDATLAATTVITREEITARQARSIEDLLAGVEGITISNSGGPGKLTSFFVRGAEADQLLVLVDGVRIGSATAGTAALQNLPVELIERIEFVRGPRSSLY